MGQPSNIMSSINPRCTWWHKMQTRLDALVESGWINHVRNSFAQQQKGRRINQFIWSIDFLLL